LCKYIIFGVVGFLGGFNEGQDIFVKKDGYLLVFQAMQSGSNHKLQTKAAFFLSKLMKDGDKHKSKEIVL